MSDSSTNILGINPIFCSNFLKIRVIEQPPYTKIISLILIELLLENNANNKNDLYIKPSSDMNLAPDKIIASNSKDNVIRTLKTPGVVEKLPGQPGGGTEPEKAERKSRFGARGRILMGV